MMLKGLRLIISNTVIGEETLYSQRSILKVCYSFNEEFRNFMTLLCARSCSGPQSLILVPNPNPNPSPSL